MGQGKSWPRLRDDAIEQAEEDWQELICREGFDPEGAELLSEWPLIGYYCADGIPLRVWDMIVDPEEGLLLCVAAPTSYGVCVGALRPEVVERVAEWNEDQMKQVCCCKRMDLMLIPEGWIQIRGAIRKAWGTSGLPRRLVLDDASQDDVDEFLCRCRNPKRVFDQFVRKEIMY